MKNGTSPIIAAVYSAWGPSEKYPWRSGGLAATNTADRFVAAFISAGTSLNVFGTRSHLPLWKASRQTGERNQETWRRFGASPSM